MEEHYSEEQLQHIHRCLIAWGRIQEMPARPFWHLDLDQLDAVELAAAADRFEAAGAGCLAIKALEKAVTPPTENMCINYRDAYRDLVAYHRQTGQYGRAILFQRCLLDYLSAQVQRVDSSDLDNECAELAELAQGSQSPDPRGWLLDDEPTLTGRYLAVSRELAERVHGGSFEPRATRLGAGIDWYDYWEEIRVHLNHRMCSWATPSSLLVASETMLVEGLLWTVLTRPTGVVLQELREFTRAVATLRLRRPETISREIRLSYEAFVGLVQKLQENVDLYRAIMEDYFIGNRKYHRQPTEIVEDAAHVFDEAPLMAYRLIAEAGSLLLTEHEANVPNVLSSAPANVRPLVRVAMNVARIAQRDSLLPLDPVEKERVRWHSCSVMEVPLRTPLIVPSLEAISAQVHPQRKRKRPETIPVQSQVGTPAQSKGAGPVKVGRNEPCPCGSGKKFKRCCGQ